MRIGKSSLLATLVAAYLAVSFATPSTVAAVQQWVSISHIAVLESNAAGDLVLPGGSLDPTDLLDGAANNEKITISAHVMVTENSQLTTALPVSNNVDVKATVPGPNKPKRVARLKGKLVQGEVFLSKKVNAKKLIGKGIVTFEVTTTGGVVEPYEATVTYKLERAASSSSRRR